MVNLRLINKKIFGVKVKDSGSKNQFISLLRLLRDVSMKSYVSERKEWEIPLNCFYELINSKQLQQEEIRTPIELELAIQEHLARLEFLEKLKYIDLPIFTLKNFKGRLKTFQQNGALFTYFGKRVLIADSVGLGKTVQSIAGSTLMEVDNIIAVVPANLRKKWKKEVKKFTPYKKIIMNQPKQRRLEIYANPDKYFCYLLSYEIMRTDADDILNNFRGRSVLLIGDEIQYVKNKSSGRTKALRKLVKNNDYFIGLSATYVETGLNDLFGVFIIVDNTVFGENENHFEKRYVIVDWMGKVSGYKRLDEIRRKIKPVVIRRRKEDVKEQLPKKITVDYWVDLSPAERKVYKEVESGVLDDVADLERANKVTMASLLNLSGYLQQAVLHPSLVGLHGTSSKLRELVPIIEGIDDSKIVVFCYYTKMVELINEELNNNDIKSLYIHGKTRDDPWDVIRKFGRKNYRVLVTSDKLREGHDILCASTIINFDLLWNPQKMKQRAGRLDRMNQLAKWITVINMMARNTVEVDKYHRVKDRKNLFTDVVDDGKESKRDKVSTLTLPNLMNVLKKRRYN